MNFIDQLKKIYLSPVKYARSIGVTVGKDTYISGKNHWPSEPYLIEIGSYCQITRGVCFFTHGGGQVLRDKYPDFDCFGKISIGNYCYIGANSIILPGVTIGNNVLVSAGSVVTKSFKSNSVIGGNPAKVICTIEDYYNKNKEYDLHSRFLSKHQKKAFLFKSSKFIIK